MRVYLVGFMGSGKSRTGKRIAALLGYGFADLDEMVEQEAGMTVSMIFNKYGEEWFRAKEREVLHATAGIDDYVIACGGGTTCFHDNMDFMKKKGITLYLEMGAPELASRLKSSGNTRPLIRDIPGDELIQWIESKLSGRTRFYELADIRASGFNADPAVLAGMLLNYKQKNSGDNSLKAGTAGVS